MKIYFGHSPRLDYQNELYAPMRNSTLNSENEILFPHEKGHPMANTKKVIQSCDAMFAEVSFPSTGLGIELGWAEAYGIPIVCVNREGSKVSFSLKWITKHFIEYANPNDLVEKVKQFLKMRKTGGPRSPQPTEATERMGTEGEVWPKPIKL